MLKQDGGRGIGPLFSSPPQGIWQLKSPHPREFATQDKKNANARGSAREGGGLGAGGIDWCISLDELLSGKPIFGRNDLIPVSLLNLLF